MSHGQRMPYCLSYLRRLNMLVYYPIQVTWVTSCICICIQRFCNTKRTLLIFSCSLNPNKYLFCLNIRYFNSCIYQVLQLGTWDPAADIQLNSTSSRVTFILSPQQRPLNESSQLFESSFFIRSESLPLLLLLPFTLRQSFPYLYTI